MKKSYIQPCLAIEVIACSSMIANSMSISDEEVGSDDILVKSNGFPWDGYNKDEDEEESDW